MKDGFMTIFEGIKSVVLNVWTAITSAASLAWNNITTVVTGVISGMKTQINTVKTTVTTVFSSVWNTISNTFNKVKTKVVTIFENVKTTIKNAIDKIKGFFNFEWKLPSIKLPHFSITGEFSLNPPSVPSIGVEWYAKGGILNRPTLFGMNGSNAMVGGEAGAEAVLPLDLLWTKLAEILKPQPSDDKPNVNNYVYVTVKSDNADDDALANTIAEKVVRAVENM